MEDRPYQERARCVPFQCESSWLYRDLQGFSHCIATEHFTNPVLSVLWPQHLQIWTKKKCFLLYILTLLMFGCFYHIMSFLCETECPVHCKSSLYCILFSVKMPVDRMRMRPWLEQQIESGEVQGLHWINEVRVEIWHQIIIHSFSEEYFHAGNI